MGCWQMLWVGIAITSANPVGVVTEDRVDLVEVNHHYDEQGRLLFDQVIFYTWSEPHRRYNVRDWRLVKSPAQLPVPHPRGGFMAVWHDDRILRRVRANAKRESWTQYDPELIERQFLSRDKRVNLAKQIAPGGLKR